MVVHVTVHAMGRDAGDPCPFACCVKTAERWCPLPRHALLVSIFDQKTSYDAMTSQHDILWRPMILVIRYPRSNGSAVKVLTAAFIDTHRRDPFYTLHHRLEREISIMLDISRMPV